MKESVVFYKSFYDAIKNIPENEQLKVYNAIFQYSFTDEEPKLEDGIAKAMFTLMKPNIDSANARYTANVENGKRGGRPKKETQQEPNKNPEKTQPKPNQNPTKTQTKPSQNPAKTQPKPKQNLNDNVDDNDNDNVDDDNNITAFEDKSSTASAKASKRKYGEYKHVMLKDEELQKLQNDYENWEELIKFLDEYVEMKGYKAKSHYLAIKKWVVNAVEEEKQRQNKQNNCNIINKRDFGVVEDF